MSWLRPHPHRGDVIAAGAVPLSIFAFVVSLRMTQWGVGARFVVVGVIAVLLLAMGWLAPLEGDAPRPYHSALLIAGLLPLIVALQQFAEVLGASRPPGDGADVWTFILEAAVAGAAARRANSGACTLIAALAFAVAVEAFVSWVFHPTGIDTFRAMLVVVALAFAAGAVRLRDRHRRHAVQLINAGGLVTVILALTLLITIGVEAMFRVTQFSSSGATSAFADLSATAGFGWKLYLLAVGFGLIAYAGVDREAGPAVVGVAVIGSFVLLVGFPLSSHGSLVGWPLFLLIIGAIGLAVGLRPREPLPPPPTQPDAEAPTVRLNPRGDA